MNEMNRLHNATNPHQGPYRKVLCVCSAGLLRSPTVALILSQKPYNFNTRAVGLDVGHALIPIDGVLLEWADEIVCMDQFQAKQIESLGVSKPIHNLMIGDNYCYRDSKLTRIIKNRLKNVNWGDNGR